MRPGKNNSISDVPGIEVGHATEVEALTGVTAVLTRAGAVAGVDVRGAAPGTRETDLLDPVNLVQSVQAIVLSGGSAFGLDSASGVMRYLEEQGVGQPVGGGRVVPIVPAAVIFDLDVGSSTLRPNAEHGYRAASSASASPPEQGNVGAGTGARAGGLKGGLGCASAVFGGKSGDELVVGALGVVNAVGRAHDPLTGELYGRGLGFPGEFGELTPPSAYGFEGNEDRDYSTLFPADSALAGRNTTIGVVATNARLDKAQAGKLAQMAHDGLARAIRPAHTMFDGDTIFALSTGDRELTSASEMAMLGAIAADVFGRALVHGMLHASSAGGLTSYCDTFPNACGPRT